VNQSLSAIWLVKWVRVLSAAQLPTAAGVRPPPR
jgi:hypothetical protein